MFSNYDFSDITCVAEKQEIRRRVAERVAEKIESEKQAKKRKAAVQAEIKERVKAKQASILMLFLVAVLWLSLCCFVLQQHIYSGLDGNPVSAVSVGDVVDGYICLARVTNTQIYGIKPNDDTMYLITLTENYDYFNDFYDSFKQKPLDYVKIVSVEVAQ